ncbi:Tn3 family transposase [Methylomonas sp. UP202]|nr:Tn3 family transposase [Methylomonas sp. UP202]WGS87878.1 Tn3 family transposase [Methylomonas sp. UP202]
MCRAISYVNGGKFRVKTETEQQIWNECSRLIANANIHYNTLILSRVYELKLAARRPGCYRDHQRHVARRLAKFESDR